MPPLIVLEGFEGSLRCTCSLLHAAASALCSPAAMAAAAQTAAAAVGPARPPAAAEVASYSARLALLRAALHAASDAALSTVPAAGHDAHNGVRAPAIVQAISLFLPTTGSALSSVRLLVPHRYSTLQQFDALESRRCTSFRMRMAMPCTGQAWFFRSSVLQRAH